MGILDITVLAVRDVLTKRRELLQAGEIWRRMNGESADTPGVKIEYETEVGGRWTKLFDLPRRRLRSSTGESKEAIDSADLPALEKIFGLSGPEFWVYLTEGTEILLRSTPYKRKLAKAARHALINIGRLPKDVSLLIMTYIGIHHTGTNVYDSHHTVAIQDVKPKHKFYRAAAPRVSDSTKVESSSADALPTTKGRDITDDLSCACCDIDVQMSEYHHCSKCDTAVCSDCYLGKPISAQQLENLIDRGFVRQRVPDISSRGGIPSMTVHGDEIKCDSNQHEVKFYPSIGQDNFLNTTNVVQRDEWLNSFGTGSEFYRKIAREWVEMQYCVYLTRMYASGKRYWIQRGSSPYAVYTDLTRARLVDGWNWDRLSVAAQKQLKYDDYESVRPKCAKYPEFLARMDLEFPKNNSLLQFEVVHHTSDADTVGTVVLMDSWALQDGEHKGYWTREKVIEEAVGEWKTGISSSRMLKPDGDDGGTPPPKPIEMADRRYVMFDVQQDWIYEPITASGMYNPGIGNLVVRCRPL
jgi:hypothetical protein